MALINGDEETGVCEKHGEYKFHRKYWQGNELPIFAKCPKCEAEEMEIQEKEKERQAKRELLDYYKREGIEPIFLDCTLDNFIADTEELKRNKEAVSKLIAKEVNILFMVGNNGTGKTHLSIAALKELGGHIYTMYEISNMIRKTYVPESSRTELDVVDDLLKNKLLIIDELGRTKGSEAETRWLSYIIDKRYARKMPLILITNKHTMKDCPSHGCENCLENYVSEDIMSRLAANGLLLKFSGADYRKKRG